MTFESVSIAALNCLGKKCPPQRFVTENIKPRHFESIQDRVRDRHKADNNAKCLEYAFPDNKLGPSD